MRAFVILMLSALPAAAHEGAHMHPHGAESWVSLVLGLAVIAAAGFVGWGIGVRRSDRDDE